MKREYPDAPILAVGGVIFDEDAVLLAKRNQQPGRGSWTLPGGVVELGEPVVDALKRELQEEAGIEVEIAGLVRVVDRIVYDDEKTVQFHYVIVDFWGFITSGCLRPGSDISDARFVPLPHISDMELQKEVKETIFIAYDMWEKRRPNLFGEPVR